MYQFFFIYKRDSGKKSVSSNFKHNGSIKIEIKIEKRFHFSTFQCYSKTKILFSIIFTNQNRNTITVLIDINDQ